MGAAALQGVLGEDGLEAPEVAVVAEEKEWAEAASDDGDGAEVASSEIYSRPIINIS